MRLTVVAVRDSALDAFMRPFFVPTVAMAERSFRDEVQRAGSEMNSHRADYALFELGTFDEQTGRVENLDTPRQVIRGADIGDK